MELLHALHAPSSRFRSAHSPSEQRPSDSERMQVDDIFFFDGHTNSLADLRTVQVRIDSLLGVSRSLASGAS